MLGSLQCTKNISEICRGRGDPLSKRFHTHIVLFFFRLQFLGQILSSLHNSHRVCTSAATRRKNWPWFSFLQGSKNRLQHFVENRETVSIWISKQRKWYSEQLKKPQKLMASMCLYQRPKNGIVCSLQKNYWSTDSGIRRQRNLMANPLHYSTLSVSAVHYSNCYQLRSWHKRVTISSGIPVSPKQMVVN